MNTTVLVWNIADGVNPAVAAQLKAGSSQPRAAEWETGMVCGAREVAWDRTPVSLASQLPQDNTTWGIQRADLVGYVPTRQAITLSLPVTAPAAAGHRVGCRMVKEHGHWFGELEERTTEVVAPEVDGRQRLRNEIEPGKQELAALQAELRSRTGSGKAFLISQNAKQQALLVQLRQAAKDKGCRDLRWSHVESMEGQ